jgi:hypothetical protein
MSKRVRVVKAQAVDRLVRGTHLAGSNGAGKVHGDPRMCEFAKT